MTSVSLVTSNGHKLQPVGNYFFQLHLVKSLWINRITNQIIYLFYWMGGRFEIFFPLVFRSLTNSVIGGDTRTSEGTRETSKYKNQDFTGLKQGQFFVFVDGKDKLYNFDLFPFKRLELKVKHHITEKDLNDNFPLWLKCNT